MTNGIFFDIMILYNWKKIKKEANSKVSDILTILHILTYKLPPVNRKDRIYKYWQKSFHGNSFLVNPEPLFIQRRLYSDTEIAQYAGIASLRNYFTPIAADRSCGIGNIGIQTLSPHLLAERLFKEFKIFTVAIDYANVKGCRITPNVFTSTEELDEFVNAMKSLAKA